jgi:transcriptional regulator with XRE-family HTH domain
MGFGRHLRVLREGAELTRAELARRAGAPASTLRGWEADRGFPGMPAALRLTAALAVPVKRFAEGMEDPAGDGPAPPPVTLKRRTSPRAVFRSHRRTRSCRVTPSK